MLFNGQSKKNIKGACKGVGEAKILSEEFAKSLKMICACVSDQHLLQDIPVELQFAVAQEFSDHLSAQALPLQQEVCYSDGRVWDEPTRDQEVDASLWVPARGQTNTSAMGAGSPAALHVCFGALERKGVWAGVRK